MGVPGELSRDGAHEVGRLNRLFSVILRPFQRQSLRSATVGSRQRMGQQLAAAVHGTGVSWEIGRQCGLSII